MNHQAEAAHAAPPRRRAPPKQMANMAPPSMPPPEHFARFRDGEPQGDGWTQPLVQPVPEQRDHVAFGSPPPKRDVPPAQNHPYHHYEQPYRSHQGHHQQWHPPTHGHIGDWGQAHHQQWQQQQQQQKQSYPGGGGWGQPQPETSCGGGRLQHRVQQHRVQQQHGQWHPAEPATQNGWGSSEPQAQQQRLAPRRAPPKAAPLPSGQRKFETFIDDDASNDEPFAPRSQTTAFSNHRALPAEPVSPIVPSPKHAAVRQKVMTSEEEKENKLAARPQQEGCALKKHSSPAKRDKKQRQAKKSALGDSAEANLSVRVPQHLAGLSTMLMAPDSPGVYVKCLVRRDRSGGSLKGRLFPTYHLFIQVDGAAPGTPPRLALVAQKQKDCRTPNYRFWDMTRTVPGAKLSKKAGNYVGKLRGNFNRDEYTVYAPDKTMLGAVVYDKTDVVSQLRDGAQPRKMGVLLPIETAKQAAALASGDAAAGPKSSASGGGRATPEERLAAMVEAKEADQTLANSTVEGEVDGKRGQFFQLSSKEPVFEKGNYRLNFRGRVKLPSVKNYQLVPPGDISNVWTQFGKVNEHDFHLDFKRPLSPLLGFAFAITQFDY